MRRVSLKNDALCCFEKCERLMSPDALFLAVTRGKFSFYYV